MFHQTMGFKDSKVLQSKKQFGNYSMSPKRDLKRCTAILEEMGFGNFLDNNRQFHQNTSHKSSIGLSDFWSDDKKKKFLRIGGYWEAYKKIQKIEVAVRAAREKVKHSSLPRIMDINTLNKVNKYYNENDKKYKKSASTLRLSNVLISESAENVNGRVSSIDVLVNRCNILAGDLEELKKNHICEDKISRRGFGYRRRKLC